MTHLHWIIWAAEGQSQGGYTGVTYVDVIAASEGEAKEKAQRLAPGRNYYWTNNVVEHHDHSRAEEPITVELTEI